MGWEQIPPFSLWLLSGPGRWTATEDLEDGNLLYRRELLCQNGRRISVFLFLRLSFSPHPQQACPQEPSSSCRASGAEAVNTESFLQS